MNNIPVFLDSSFIIAVINADDSLHKKALDLETELKNRSQIWITEPVLFEIANSFSKTNKYKVSQFIEFCYESERITVVALTMELLHDALFMYSNYSDKEWSLTDCLSFVVMKKEQITIAYTSDHHFLQAGFQALLLR